MTKIKAAVIGLGNIGFQFAKDAKRTGTWSHVLAYIRCDKTRLVGAVEIDREKSRLFRESVKDVPVFRSVRDLFRKTDVDIVSICTPTPTHYPIMKDILEHGVKGVFCEKPLALSVKEALDMVSMCRRKGVVLAVNHTRRWDDNYMLARDIVRGGEIGSVRGVNAFYPGQIFNVGSHLLDTVAMIAEKRALRVSGLSFNIDDPDPDVSGWIELEGGIPCVVVSTGKREDLVFEIDVLGSEGRVKVVENGGRVEAYRFKESTRYTGYRELAPLSTKVSKGNDRLLDAVDDICASIAGGKKRVNCAGEDGLSALALCESLFLSAKRLGMVVKVEGRSG